MTTGRTIREALKAATVALLVAFAIAGHAGRTVEPIALRRPEVVRTTEAP